MKWKRYLLLYFLPGIIWGLSSCAGIQMEGDEPRARIDEGKCMGCGLCTITCPTEAILLKEAQPPESIPV